MARLVRASRARWLGAAFVALLLPPATAAAEDQTGGECGDASTPNLVITAATAGKNVPRLTLTVQTNKDAVPHWNVIYRDGRNVLDSLEIHRVFIKAQEGDTGDSGSGSCEGTSWIYNSAGSTCGRSTFSNAELIRETDLGGEVLCANSSSGSVATTDVTVNEGESK